MWSSKPKKVEASGFFGDTSPEQEQCLAQLKEFVQAANLNPEGRWDDYDFLRFCRARKFQIAEVQKMFMNHLEWRKNEQIDGLHLSWVFPEKE